MLTRTNFRRWLLFKGERRRIRALHLTCKKICNRLAVKIRRSVFQTWCDRMICTLHLRRTMRRKLTKHRVYAMKSFFTCWYLVYTHEFRLKQRILQTTAKKIQTHMCAAITTWYNNVSKKRYWNSKFEVDFETYSLLVFKQKERHRVVLILRAWYGRTALSFFFHRHCERLLARLKPKLQKRYLTKWYLSSRVALDIRNYSLLAVAEEKKLSLRDLRMLMVCHSEGMRRGF